MSKKQINIATLINHSAVRYEKYNGRDHLVIPSYTLPFDVVMNNIFYPREQIENNYQKLEGKLAPIGHPHGEDGKPVSASSVEGLNTAHVGAWNRNVRLEGSRVYSEKWVDIEKAKESEKGRELLERIKDRKPISSSVSVYAETLPAPQGAQYKSIANILDFDHDAILLHEPPAASTSQGVGLLVNTADAIMIDTQKKDIRDQLKAALGNDSLVDFNDRQVIAINNENVTVYEYKDDNGVITLTNTDKAYNKKSLWDFFNFKKEKKSMEKENTLTVEGVGKIVADALMKNNEEQEAKRKAEEEANAKKALEDEVARLKAENEELKKGKQQNNEADEAKMREEVGKVVGKTVADQLNNEQLTDAYKNIGKSHEQLNNSLGGDDKGVPTVNDYLDSVYGKEK